MKYKKGLSVTLATYNEEENLDKCLSAIDKLANEIIIADGSSTDKTVDIAKKHNAKIIRTTNKPNFHINKAMANKKASYEWVLQLDADEEVSPELASEVKQIIDGEYFGLDSYQTPTKKFLSTILPIKKVNLLTKSAEAYYIPRRNFFLGSFLYNTGQYPDPVIRLFKNGKAYLPAKDVHEQMVVQGNIGFLKNDLLHWATPKFSRYMLRENRYSSLLAKQMKDAGIKVTMLNDVYYLFLKPLKTFLKMYFRYRGFMDGFPGFVFSVFSGLHFAFAYIKMWQLYEKDKS